MAGGEMSCTFKTPEFASWRLQANILSNTGDLRGKGREGKERCRETVIRKACPDREVDEECRCLNDSK